MDKGSKTKQSQTSQLAALTWAPRPTPQVLLSPVATTQAWKLKGQVKKTVGTLRSDAKEACGHLDFICSCLESAETARACPGRAGGAPWEPPRDPSPPQTVWRLEVA